jgi:hypothetical protein
MMRHFANRRPQAPHVERRPVLDLSGPKLRDAFEHLIEAAERTGGIERDVGALALKASLFDEILGNGRVTAATESEFRDLCAFITPVRRRVGARLEDGGFAVIRRRLEALLHGSSDVTTADRRFRTFVASFPTDREHRWVRDLAAEVLHFTAPRSYPLMTRWIWDRRVDTGVLREIWHGEDAAGRIAIDDDFSAFAALGEELEGFLENNGVFRELPFYIDLLCAHIYASYINDRGGRFLRTDFCGEEDRMTHTRRLLGLDAVASESGRTRLKLIDGRAHVLREPLRLHS